MADAEARVRLPGRPRSAGRCGLDLPRAPCVRPRCCGGGSVVNEVACDGSPPTPRNPFGPGAGNLPLCWRAARPSGANRETSSQISAPAAPARSIGCRRRAEMGTTVLLRDLQQAAPDTIHWTTGAELSDLPSLARELADPVDRLTLGVWSHDRRPRGTAARPGRIVVGGRRSRRSCATAGSRGWWSLTRPMPCRLTSQRAAERRAGVRRFRRCSGRSPVGRHAWAPAFSASDEVNASFVERAPLIVSGLLSPAESR